MISTCRLTGLAMVTAMAWLLSTAPADARIQSDFVCWVPDCEFPVDCDGEE